MAAAGVHEGKNEINARVVGYFGLGINLHTETPSPAVLKTAVQEVMVDASYKNRIKQLSSEFRGYNALSLAEHYVYHVTGYKAVVKQRALTSQE
jgi:UDP:flavonoid glycosyltransferase YjiC (YdhE family)